MRQRTLHLFVLLMGTCALLLFTANAAISAAIVPVQQANPPANTPLSPEALEQFWQEMYPTADLFGTANVDNVYTYELLAKAEPDECFNGIGITATVADLPDCESGIPKVNEAYVWGLTDYEDSSWFGTAPNVHCLVLGAFLSNTVPIQTDSYVCEFGEGPYAPPLPDVIGDWRPPNAYVYDHTTEELTEVSPNGQDGRFFDPRFVSNTLGIRSAGTIDNYVLLAGPAFSPTGSINVFLFDAATRTYRGAANLPSYNNIRKWLEVDGVLYAAVGKGDDGAILRYTGDPGNVNPLLRFSFVEVGAVDEDAAELALYDGRIFVNTWPGGLAIGSGDVGGLWMSPPIPVGGLTNANLNQWQKVFAYDEYEPDPLIAQTYGGGALHAFGGELYWGTMHVPFLATLAHLGAYIDDYQTSDPSRPDQIDILSAVLGSQRSIVIFKGSDFGTPDQVVEVAYGMPQLPSFDPLSLTWGLTDTLLGPPLYGLSGFDNMFNNYTWSMAEYDGQLFVGTMDWSYLIEDLLDTLTGVLPLPIEFEISLPDATPGADLFRFYANDQPAIPESLDGVGNYSSYGIRNLLGREDGLYLGMANPMNLLTDLEDDKPEGGWELLRLTRHLIPLTVGLGGNGSGSVAASLPEISCGADCSASYDYGTSVVLTPTADTGSTFTGWSNVCFGLGSCTVELLAETALTANFTLNVYTFAVALAGDGSGSVLSDVAGINCGTACEESYDYGTTVQLTPTAADGSVFTGWSGACSGTGPCVVTVTGDTQVTATFANNRFPLTVNIVGGGSGFVSSMPAGLACSQPSCTATFDSGTAVSLSAIAFSGSSFESWGGACSGSGACEVTIGTGTTVITASFGQNPDQTTLEVGGDPVVGSTLFFTATLNLNPITACEWDFGDGTTEPCDLDVAAAGVDAVHDVEIQTTHVYTQAGVYVVIVTASNDAGTSVAAQQVSIQTPTAEEETEQPGDPSNLFFPFLNRD